MKKILIIEDNSDIRGNTGEILSLAGYEVISACNGKEGVEVAIAETPSLILCDIMMPELDGYGVFHVLTKNAKTAGIPFIFLSAKAERSEIRKGMDLGADDYLTKPFDDTELLQAIEARLKKKEIEIAREEDGADEPGLYTDTNLELALSNLVKEKKVKTFKKKSEVFVHGDMPVAVYYVQSGEVKAFKSHQDGKELITHVYKPGDLFGFEPLLENLAYTESAVALQDAELAIIPKAEFLNFVRGHKNVSNSLLSLLCRKLAEKESQLVNLAYSTVRQRTAEVLLKAVQSNPPGDRITISREDLARMVGTASESIIRILSEFKSEGLIESEGTAIKVLHPDKLEKVVRWNVVR